MQQIITPLGCKVEIQRAPEHLGEGVMLYLRMVDKTDTRHVEVEVFLDVVTAQLVIEALWAEL